MSDERVITGIDHAGVQVGDLDAALALFVDRLGGELLERGFGPDGVTPVAFVRFGDVELEVFQRDGVEGAVLDHLALRTGEDVAVAAATLEGRGIAAATPPIAGARGTRAVRLEPSTTLGLRMHLCEQTSDLQDLPPVEEVTRGP
jgi:catechol 2,3-dioxygenase-like lactoylglutathione lyase family enzyme